MNKLAYNLGYAAAFRLIKAAAGVNTSPGELNAEYVKVDPITGRRTADWSRHSRANEVNASRNSLRSMLGMSAKPALPTTTPPKPDTGFLAPEHKVNPDAGDFF